MSKRTPPAIKDLIVELSKKGKYVSEIFIYKCTNKPWRTCKKTLQKYWETGSTENTWNNIRQVKCTARDFIRLTRIIKTDSSASTKAKFADFLNENPNGHFTGQLCIRMLKRIRIFKRALRKGVINPESERG